MALYSKLTAISSSSTAGVMWILLQFLFNKSLIDLVILWCITGTTHYFIVAFYV